LLLLQSDLKPSNIGFDKNGIVKIFDFGLARESIDNTSSSAFKKPRLMTGGAGTPRYMAPEVAKRSRVYGMPADVYSFSILLWQIATKKVPYAEITCPVEFAAKVVQKNLRPNLGLVQSQSLQMIIEQAWSSEPSHRPSFAAIVEGLHAVMDEIELLPETTSDTKKTHPYKTVKKNASVRYLKPSKEPQTIKRRLSERLKLQQCPEVQKNEVTACDPATSLMHRLRSSHYLLNAISFRSFQTESEGGESEQ
jgi:serine/threonine protein kinase